MTETPITFYRERYEAVSGPVDAPHHVPSDFARGQRANPDAAWVTGDFATGIRTLPALLTAGDFASGMRTLPASLTVIGDFATGMRTLAAPRSARPEIISDLDSLALAA